MAFIEAPSRPPYVSAALLIGGLALAAYGFNEISEIGQDTEFTEYFKGLEDKFKDFRAAHPEIPEQDARGAYLTEHPEDKAKVAAYTEKYGARALGSVAGVLVGGTGAVLGGAGIIIDVARRLVGSKPQHA